jgi:hypothetical protein
MVREHIVEESDQCQAVTRSMVREETPTEKPSENWLGAVPLSSEAFQEAPTSDPVLSKLRSWKVKNLAGNWYPLRAQY